RKDKGGVTLWWKRMDRREPDSKPDFKVKPPRWNFPWWYLPVMLAMLWIWQSTITHFAYREIPYSEFKAHLRKGEVTECTVREESIDGKIRLSGEPATAKAPGGQTNATVTAAGPKEFLFHTIRVQDPKLVEELEAAKINFKGERPGFLSQFLL